MLLIGRDLDLRRLPRGRMFCTSWGKAAGDFHFVLERPHALALWAVHFPTAQPLLFSGHGWIKAVVTAALGELPTAPAARCGQRAAGGGAVPATRAPGVLVDSEWCPPLQATKFGQGAVVNDQQVIGGMVRD